MLRLRSNDIATADPLFSEHLFKLDEAAVTAVDQAGMDIA